MSAPKLTALELSVLRLCAERLNPWTGGTGRSVPVRVGTRTVSQALNRLRRKGMIGNRSIVETGGYEPTDAGRAALAAHEGDRK